MHKAQNRRKFEASSFVKSEHELNEYLNSKISSNLKFAQIFLAIHNKNLS